MAGLDPTGADIEYAADVVISNLRVSVKHAEGIRDFLASKTDQELIDDYDLDQDTVTLLKTIFWAGTGELPAVIAAFNDTIFAKRRFGLGTSGIIAI